MEEWKDIPGLEGRYQASSLGKIRSVSRMVPFGRGGKGLRRVTSRVLKTANKINGAGYAGFGTGQNTCEMVHTAVCLAFHGPRNGRTVNHKNFQKLDNRASNLEWVSQLENHNHAKQGGRFDKFYKKLSKKSRGSGNPKAKLTEAKVVKIRKSKEFNRILAVKYGVSKSTIDQITQRKTWKHVR